MQKDGQCFVLDCGATRLCHLLSRQVAWFCDVNLWHLVYKHINGHLAGVTACVSYASLPKGFCPTPSLGV